MVVLEARSPLIVLVALAVGISWILYESTDPRLLDDDSGQESTGEVFALKNQEAKPKDSEQPEIVEDESPLAQTEDMVPTSLSQDESLQASTFGSTLSGAGASLGTGDGGGLQGQEMMAKSQETRSPKITLRIAPVYPAEARQKSVVGQVTIKIEVDSSGRLGSVRVLESEPRGVFDNAAREAVKKWRFEPALMKGRAVAGVLKQRLRFELN